MHGWIELATYSPLKSLLFGSLTALAFRGIGYLVIGAALRNAPDFLRVPAELITGALITALIVELCAMADMTSPGAMQALWWAILAIAVASPVRLILRPASTDAAGRNPSLGGWHGFPAALMGGAVLIAAMAPESRSDEMAYHALASARLLSDAGLRFYPLPWEASVLPQFGWHFALVPLYAVGGSAAAGVTSAWFALALALAAAQLVNWQTRSGILAASAAFIVLAGGYSIVFFPTTGPHAFGYLAVFVAVTAVAWSGAAADSNRCIAYPLVVAVGCAGALAGKITLLPVVAVVTGLAAWDVSRKPSDAQHASTALAVLVLIPALAVLPLLVWMWLTTGSPLGPITAHLFQASSLDTEALAAYEGTRELFASNFQWKFEAAYWSLPLAFCAILALVYEPDAHRRRRLRLIAGCQALVIVFLLPHEVRHFGGIQYPLLASGLAALALRIRARGYSDLKLAAAVCITATPWALLVLWLTTIYIPVMTGSVSALQFVRQYSGLQNDYDSLDRILPADAEILLGRSKSSSIQYGWYARPPIYYAPRRVLFHTSEVRNPDHLYLLYIAAGEPDAQGMPIPFDPWLPRGYALGPSVYSNAHARFYPSRSPRGSTGLARVDVVELVKKPQLAEVNVKKP